MKATKETKLSKWIDYLRKINNDVHIAIDNLSEIYNAHKQGDFTYNFARHYATVSYHFATIELCKVFDVPKENNKSNEKRSLNELLRKLNSRDFRKDNGVEEMIINNSKKTKNEQIIQIKDFKTIRTFNSLTELNNCYNKLLQIIENKSELIGGLKKRRNKIYAHGTNSYERLFKILDEEQELDELKYLSQLSNKMFNMIICKLGQSYCQFDNFSPMQDVTLCIKRIK